MARRALARWPFIAVAVISLIGVGWGASTRGANALNELAAPRLLRTSAEPAGMAIDNATGRAFVADTNENSLFVFDLSSGATIAHVPTGLRPHQVLVAGDRVFVSNSGDGTLTVVDTTTNQATKTIAIGGLGIAINSQTARLYAAEGARGISVIDVSSDRRATTISAPTGANIWGLALDATIDRLYATDIANPRVLVFQASTGELIRSVALSAPSRFGIAASSGRLFVATYTDTSPELVAVDGLTGSVLARRAVAPWTSVVALQATSSVVYTASARDRSVMSVDTGTRATLSKATLADAPGALALSPLTGEPIAATRGGAAPPARAFPDIVPVVRP